MENEEGFVFNQTRADADLIEKIKIKWVAGDVNIVKYDGEEIKFSESSHSHLNEKTAMVSKVEGNELIIHFTKEKKHSLWGNLKKTLNVSLPKDLKVLFVSAVSANVFVNGLTVNEFVGDSVSGCLKAENLDAKKMAFKTISGVVKLTGCFDMIKGNSISGRTEVISSVCPSRIWIETVSGLISVTVPENEGFTAQIERVSGTVRSDFDLRVNDKYMVYGDGNALFKLKTVSGKTSINRL